MIITEYTEWNGTSMIGVVLSTTIQVERLWVKKIWLFLRMNVYYNWYYRVVGYTIAYRQYTVCSTLISVILYICIYFIKIIMYIKIAGLRI